jgi:hypothetical protein
VASERPSVWEAVNAAPEVVTIGQVARIVQRLAQQRGRRVRVDGAAASEATFQVRSKMPFEARHSVERDLGEVFDFFLAAEACRSS